MQEIWKDIVGYEGMYQISTLGRVKSLPRKARNGKTVKGGILKTNTNRGGYSYINLNKNCTPKSITIHRLVALHFIPNPNNLPQINHKDENKLNNCVDNLEWCTQEYNNNYGTRNERMKSKIQGIPKPYMAEYNKQTKSKPVGQFDKDMNLIATFPSISEAGRQLKLDIGYIGNCCLGKYKTAYGYIFKYL